MDIKISPSTLKGKVKIPASKSYVHRMLICAALSNGISEIKDISFSKDISATISSLTELGADFETYKNTVAVRGIESPCGKAVIDCCESGSTLRFIIPIAAALGVNAQFIGEGRLPHRPIDIYIRELSAKGIKFDYNNTMPFNICGQLHGGTFALEGDVSSQFVTGLLFALPLLKENSEIVLTSPLESKPYADMTIECLKKFGVEVSETENGYKINGNQQYKPYNASVEGDYSQAAFFYTANALGSNVEISGLNPNSVQGDRKILEIIDSMCYNKSCLGSFKAGCKDIPDLVPILAVLGCFGNDTSEIYNAQRLRIKESDRLQSVSDMLNKLGGNVTVKEDGLVIEPVRTLHGGVVDSCGDHRIAMCAAIAALRADGDVIIQGAESVEKSYPNFFEDYNNLGGKASVIIME